MLNLIRKQTSSLLSKIIRNQTTEDENRSSPPRHAREGGHPVVLLLSSMAWIPASAGMTNSGPVAIGFPNALPMLILPLIENRFWTRIVKEINKGGRVS